MSAKGKVELERLLTYEEAGDHLGISGKAMSDLARRGEIPRVVLSERKHRIHPDDLVAYIEKHRRIAS
ncbi:excisionase family DNA binding protein [Rhodococcus sp. BE178]